MPGLHKSTTQRLPCLIGSPTVPFVVLRLIDSFVFPTSVYRLVCVHSRLYPLWLPQGIPYRLWHSHCSYLFIRLLHLAANERLQLLKALFVSCDSHDLQPLIKDVPGIPHYKIIPFQIMLVINIFRQSPLQLLLLGEKQRAYYGKTSALVLAVITHWGTQVCAIESI